MLERMMTSTNGHCEFPDFALISIDNRAEQLFHLC